MIPGPTLWVCIEVRIMGHGTRPAQSVSSLRAAYPPPTSVLPALKPCLVSLGQLILDEAGSSFCAASSTYHCILYYA
jgi:hypothetical protein